VGSGAAAGGGASPRDGVRVLQGRWCAGSTERPLFSQNIDRKTLDLYQVRDFRQGKLGQIVLDSAQISGKSGRRFREIRGQGAPELNGR